MQLDDLKEAWQAHGRALEKSLAIDERILRELLLRKVRVALAPFVVVRALEVVVGIGALFLVMPVLVAHLGEPRYLVVGGTVAVLALWITGLCAYLLVNSLQLDWGGAVTSIQRDVERIKLAEYRALKWALLGGVVVWLPGLLVLFEALTGVDALARVDLAYLVGNFAIGLAVLALGLALSRRYVERSDLGPRARRVIDALSGRSLRVAQGHLAELAKFQREDPGAESGSNGGGHGAR
jgi:hypothetical protein